MNFFEKIIYMFQETMEEPEAFGWFHLLWIFFIIVVLFILYKLKNRYCDKQLKTVLFVYGFVALVLEIIKQVIWSFNYENGVVTWDYQWYAFPFQLCTTPIYVSLLCLFLKDNKLRKSLLSYLSFVTILGDIMTVILPDSCFVETIEVNIHTMWLHCGSLVVSIYLVMTKEVELNIKNLINAFIVFLIFVFLAEILNIIVFNSGILNGETFDMFYISPYFISDLPVFNQIQENVPFIIFLIIYVLCILIGSFIVYFIEKIIIKNR